MRRIDFLVYPGYSVMAFAVATVFELVNDFHHSGTYDIRFISEIGGPIRTSAGLTVDSEPFADASGDTLMVGGAQEPHFQTAGMVDFVRGSLDRYRRVAGICTGAFVLALGGLLDGRRATTHWFNARDLQTSFPQVNMDEDKIFVNDGPVWTSAGMSAGIDLGLALVEADLGAEIARSVARKLVVYHRRTGGQSQFSALLEMQPKSDRIQTALVYAKEHLDATLSVEQLAEVAHLSVRQFSRAFHSETGQSPAKAIENLRVEAARDLMEQTRHSLEVVARMTGFGDPDRMRRAFLRVFGQPPQVMRRNAKREGELLAIAG